MPHSILNPSDLHDPTPFGYSHTARVDAGSALVFVSGQYGSRPDGSVVSAEFEEQMKQAIRNLGVALAAHDLELSAVVQLRTYIVNLDYGKLGAIAETIGASWGTSPPTQTLIGVQSLATPEILFEVEAVAVRSAAAHA